MGPRRSIKYVSSWTRVPPPSVETVARPPSKSTPPRTSRRVDVRGTPVCRFLDLFVYRRREPSHYVETLTGTGRCDLEVGVEKVVLRTPTPPSRSPSTALINLHSPGYVPTQPLIYEFRSVKTLPGHGRNLRVTIQDLPGHVSSPGWSPVVIPRLRGDTRPITDYLELYSHLFIFGQPPQ